MGIIEFKQYLHLRPTAVFNEIQLLAILNDAMGNEKKLYRALHDAYNAGILDAIKALNPPSIDEQQRILGTLKSQYALSETTAKFAIDFWIQSFDGFSFDGSNSLTSFMELPKSITENETSPSPKLVTINYNTLRNEVSVQWHRQLDVESYEIWRSSGTDKATMIGQSTFPLPRISDKNIIANEIYTYIICAKLKSTGQRTSYSNFLQIATPADKRQFEISEARIVKEGIQLRWTYQADTIQYVVHRKDLLNNNEESTYTLSNTQFAFIDSTATDGAQYAYRIECQRRNSEPLLSREIMLTI